MSTERLLLILVGAMMLLPGCRASLPAAPDRMELITKVDVAPARTMNAVRQIVSESGGRMLVDDEASGLIVFSAAPQVMRPRTAGESIDAPINDRIYFNVLVARSERGPGSVVYVIPRMSRGLAPAGEGGRFCRRLERTLGGVR